MRTGIKEGEMFCPMKFNSKTLDADGAFRTDQCHCEESDCAWWVVPYTTEVLRTEGMCAIEMIAMKAPAQYQV